MSNIIAVNTGTTSRVVGVDKTENNRRNFQDLGDWSSPMMRSGDGSKFRPATGIAFDLCLNFHEINCSIIVKPGQCKNIWNGSFLKLRFITNSRDIWFSCTSVPNYQIIIYISVLLLKYSCMLHNYFEYGVMFKILLHFRSPLLNWNILMWART